MSPVKHSHSPAPPTEASSPPVSPKTGTWSSQEQVQLFQHVINHGKVDWEWAVPSRSANQARQQWKNVLEKQIVGFLTTKEPTHHR